MGMIPGEPPLLPWWARYTHLQRVVHRLRDNDRFNKPLDDGDLTYPVEGQVASPRTWKG